MKAGKGMLWWNYKRGIRNTNPNVSVVRLWSIFLQNTNRSPEYFSLQANDIPKTSIDRWRWMDQILSGEIWQHDCQGPVLFKAFLYHIHFGAEKQFSIITDINIGVCRHFFDKQRCYEWHEIWSWRIHRIQLRGKLIEINNNGKTAVILFYLRRTIQWT